MNPLLRSLPLGAATGALLLLTAPASPADLQPRTVAAFDRYATLTEARLSADTPFLWVDTLPETEQRARHDELRRGELVIERLKTRDGRNDIPVPDGLVHHWIGTVFVPGATVDRALALLQDYDRHAEVYRPLITQSRLLARDGDTFRMFLRFVTKKVITVVVNGEHEARFTRDRPDRAASRIRSTRIAQVEDAGTPTEREMPVGRDDGGYLWRLNTYWRFLERDGGTYVQCESVSLTRGIPLGFGWLIGPFVTSIPRESLEFTLTTTRKALSP